MDTDQLQTALSDLNLGAIRYFARIDSTNDEAARWIEDGAPDLSLVVSDEQTSGHGRDGRAWYTPAGTALAFSLVIYPKAKVTHIASRLTALGALAVRETLFQYYDLPAQIKWPNDVLVHRRKLAGILAEASWSGDQLKALILGIGINVAPQAVIEAESREGKLSFPAGSIEEFTRGPVDRVVLLRQVIEEIFAWRPRVVTQEFLQEWEAHLAFRGEQVQVTIGQSTGKDGFPRNLEGIPPAIETGRILGLSPDGSLRLRKNDGEVVNIHFGEVRLRPIETS